MLATILQIVGLILFIAGASLEFGAAGALASSGVAAVFVGLAADR
jgi:hypothetical protein